MTTRATPTCLAGALGLPCPVMLYLLPRGFGPQLCHRLCLLQLLPLPLLLQLALLLLVKRQTQHAARPRR